MIPDLTILKAKLVASYVGSSLTNEQIAAELNDAAGVHKAVKNVPISSTELMAWSGGGEGRYMQLKNGAEDTNKSNQIRSQCYAALSILSNTDAELDLSKPDRAGMVASLVAGGVLTETDKAALEALGSEDISWATANGYGKIEAKYVRWAKQ